MLMETNGSATNAAISAPAITREGGEGARSDHAMATETRTTEERISLNSVIG